MKTLILLNLLFHMSPVRIYVLDNFDCREIVIDSVYRITERDDQLKFYGRRGIKAQLDKRKYSYLTQEYTNPNNKEQ